MSRSQCAHSMRRASSVALVLPFLSSLRRLLARTSALLRNAASFFRSLFFARSLAFLSRTFASSCGFGTVIAAALTYLCDVAAKGVSSPPPHAQHIVSELNVAELYPPHQ